jgi:hypothetical protein
MAFFIVFGSTTMGLCRKFVVLCGFLVCVVHDVPPAEAQ